MTGKDLLEGVLDRIQRNIVWSRSLDRPYQIWQRMAIFLYSTYEHNGVDEEAREQFLSFVQQARDLPKSRRDPDFRVLCDIGEALAMLLDELYTERLEMQDEILTLRAELDACEDALTTNEKDLEDVK